MFRIRVTRLRAAAAAALFSLALAAPALADHDDWGDDDGPRSRGYPVHRHERSCDRDDSRGHHGGYDHRRGRGDYAEGRSHYGHDYRRRDEYGCRPCGRRWGSQGSFHRHLSRHHGVPYRVIPRVLVYFDGGWLFRG